MHTGIAGGLDRMGAAAQMPWCRTRCLRMAMWEGQSITRGNLLHRFADLDIQQILPGLLDVAKDMVLVLAGSMATGGLIGGVVGGAVGAFGAGAGAVPGALAGAAGGAAIGLEVGNWILVLLGLGAIGEFVLARLPRLINKYKRGIAIAWSGPQGPTGPYQDSHAHDREQDAIHDAAKAFAAADEALVILLLAGMAAYLWHRGGKAANVLVREASAGRLGEKFGDWLARNAEKLKAREDLGSGQRSGLARREPALKEKQARRNEELTPGAEEIGATAPATTGAAASTNNSVEYPFSTYDTSITRPGSEYLNVQTNVTANQFQNNLISDGYSVVSQGTNKNGFFVVLNKGDSTYTIYTRTATGHAGAQYFGPNGVSAKFSFESQ